MGYRLVDDELPRLIAARLGTTPEVVESLADRPPAFGERVIAQFVAAMPESVTPVSPDVADFSTSLRREAETIVRAAAENGDAVIVGRMGGAILGARPDVLRAFVTAPLDWRVEQVARSLESSRDAARAEILRIDEARRRFARDAYGVEWGSAGAYDLVLDTSRFGVGGSAEVLAAAMRAASA